MALRDPSTTLSALQDFQKLQSSRAKEYNKFHAAFQAMLHTHQEGPYLKLLPELTLSFNNISQAIISIEKKLSTELGRPDLAALLRRVQDNEREKLRLTIAMQSLKKAYHFESFSWQQPDQEPDWSDGAEIDRLKINDHGHEAGCCHDHTPVQTPEPSEQEWSDACAEATKGLQRVTEVINDTMEEIRYEVADMGGDST